MAEKKSFFSKLKPKCCPNSVVLSAVELCVVKFGINWSTGEAVGASNLPGVGCVGGHMYNELGQRCLC